MSLQISVAFVWLSKRKSMMRRREEMLYCTNFQRGKRVLLILEIRPISIEQGSSI
jgi:hypothetical protein